MIWGHDLKNMQTKKRELKNEIVEQGIRTLKQKYVRIMMKRILENPPPKILLWV